MEGRRMLFRCFINAGPGSSLFLGLLGLLLCVAVSGCRTPWRATSAQPDFDRLIELERQQSGQPTSAREPLAARHRPGANLRSTSTARKADASARDQFELVEDEEFDLADTQDDSRAVHRSLSDSEDSTDADDTTEELLTDVPAGQRDLLRREITAMRDRGAAVLNPPATPKSASRGAPAVDAEQQAGYVGNSRYQLAAQDSQQPLRNTVPPRAVEASVTESRAAESRDLASQQAYSRRFSDDVPSATENSPQTTTPPTTQTTAQTNAPRSIPAIGLAVHPPAGKPVDNAVEAASYSSQPAADSLPGSAHQLDSTTTPDLGWREHIYQALEQLEQEAAASSPEEQVHRAMVDRLLHLSLGDLNAASEPIDGLQSNGQDFIRYSLQALHAAADPAGNPVEIKRYTLAMLSQRKALSHLAAVSNLEVLNATFCSEVDGFGVVTKFPQYSFKRDQELLLYCELDNFVSTHLEGKGFETQLQGSYEIVDSTGRRIADQLLPMDSHLCRNQRRDYFIAYRIYMPPNIDPGKYQLKLTVEDLKGRKFGQSNLAFEISM
jgi:hypothetical protein